MSAGGRPVGGRTRTERHAWWLAVAVGVVFLLPAPTYVISGFHGGWGGPSRGPAIVVVMLAAAIGAIHLYHTAAAARRVRHTCWPWTFCALVALVYVPILWWRWDWVSLQWFLMSSSALLLKSRLGVAVAVLPAVGMVGYAVWFAAIGDISIGWALTFAGYWLGGLGLGGVCLYGAARLVQAVSELDAARAELAESAIGRERLRVSRDLHDLLGHSLSAVSLKGDLALALLRRDLPAARAEIEGLTEVAREALHGIRAVARDEHAISLPTEVDGAAALLSAAGIRTQVQVDHPGGSAAVQQLLAWAVREGTTNVIRHSDARTCSITMSRQSGNVRLEIVNDGARPPSGKGSGLAGLGERAGALSGSMATEHAGNRFRLTIDIPEEAT